jgi:hypothetical protein
MKKILLFLIPVLITTACTEKEITAPPSVHPEMRYTDLANKVIKFGQQKSLNIDGNHTNDLLFSTMLVGDPVLRRDRRQYYVTGAFDVFLLVNNLEQCPVLKAGDTITLNDHPGFNWYNANSIVLAEKIIEEKGPDHWEGNWKNTHHRYLPLQVRRNDLRYNGWVEISFQTGAEEMTLHRAAISVEEGKTVEAGR